MENDNSAHDEGLAGAGGGKILYRAMRDDPAGGPLVGPTARTLGVRPSIDIAMTAGVVQPNTGGLSVAPDRPDNLHPLRRPAALGGSGKDPVWFIPAASLGADLQYRQDSPTHGLLEPIRTMRIDELQRALEATKPQWRKLP
jgi:hypothetical protein